jgi:nucleoside-diphosphate-sugar epimerase
MTLTVRRQGRMPQHAARVVNAVKGGLQVICQATAGAASVVLGRIKQFHGLQTLVRDFYRNLAEGKPAPVTPAEARAATEWTERIARQADEAKQVFDRKHRYPSLRNPILVTGANGFIGRRLVARLLAQGHAIRALVRNAPTSAMFQDSRVEVIVGDLGDPDAVERAVRGTDVIYHLGAAVRGSTSEFDRGTIVGTQNIVESAIRHKVRKLVYMSSLSVLKAYPAQQAPLTEDSEFEPFPAMRGNYTRTKLAAEKYVVDAVRDRGLPAVILRPAEVIGAGAAVISSGVAQRRGSRLIVIGNGRLQVPMVHVEDLIDGVLLAEKSEFFDGSVFQFVDPLSLSQNEIIATFNRGTAKQLRVRHVPRFVFYALAAMLQSIFCILRRSAPLTVYRLRSALATRHFDGSRAERHLGWRPVRGVRAGLAEAIDGLSKSPSHNKHLVEHCTNGKKDGDKCLGEFNTLPYATREAVPEQFERHKIHF